MIVGVAHLARCRRLQRVLERAGKVRDAESLKHVLDQVDDYFRVALPKPTPAPRRSRAKAPVLPPQPAWPFPVSAHTETP